MKKFLILLIATSILTIFSSCEVDNNDSDFEINQNISSTYKPIMPPVLVPSSRIKSNTQVKLPNNLILGDVDGDCIDEFIQFKNNKIFIFKTDKKQTGMMHHYLPHKIVKVVVGNFKKNGS